MPSNSEAVLKRLANEALIIRRNVWRAFHAAGSGHIGGSSSAADLLAALYFHYLKLRPDEPDWPERDRFVLSKGHANGALAAVLAQAGFFPDSHLDDFYGYQTMMGMHPDIKLAGVEMCTGALGHGLVVAAGELNFSRLDGRRTGKRERDQRHRAERGYAQPVNQFSLHPLKLL